MPSYIEEPEAAACKWVSIRERNRERFDLPTVFSILIYTHPATVPLEYERALAAGVGVEKKMIST